MTATLRSIGRQHEPTDPLQFDYFGEILTPRAELTDLEYLDFIDEASEVDANSTAGRRFLKDFARLIWGDDFDRFWATAKTNRQSTSDVFDTLSEVLEAVTARPTGQPSDSSDGQQSTAPRSAAVSSSVAEQLAGRPDLQLFVSQAAEARAAG